MSNQLEYLAGYTPADFGFGDEFPEFRKDPRNGREVQLEAIEFAAYSDKRFVGMSVPTGVGKSLIAVTVQKLSGLRTVVLTGTKGLQSQYQNSFSKYGLVTIMGRSNYRCGDHQDQTCLGGSTAGCRYVGGKGCEYEVQKAKACNADLVSSNYAYWINVNDRANGLQRNQQDSEFYGENPVELLILDEGDSAREWLEQYLSVRVYESEIKRWVDPKEVHDEPEVWKGLAEVAAGEVKEELEAKRLVLKSKSRQAKHEEIEEVLKLERLLQKFERIKDIEENEWVIERRDGTRWGRMWAFDVIWPGRYAEKYLFCGVPKVVVMSATLRPKEMRLLGVGKEKFEFKEWDRIFPANRHQIYLCPPTKQAGGKTVEIRIDRRTSQEDLELWVEWMDKFIDQVQDRKGLMVTTSYDYQRFILNNSRHSSIMMGNTAEPESDSAAEVAELFKKSRPPQILVSPSFGRGYNFPMDECEYILIPKLPLKPNHGKLAKARDDRDPQYSFHLTMRDIEQISGRGMRDFIDRCQVVLMDGHAGWFLYRNKNLASQWFVSAVRRVSEIPKAAEKL